MITKDVVEKDVEVWNVERQEVEVFVYKDEELSECGLKRTVSKDICNMLSEVIEDTRQACGLAKGTKATTLTDHTKSYLYQHEEELASLVGKLKKITKLYNALSKVTS